MKITTLIENTKYEKAGDVKAEHGISLLVEFNSQKFLFDTGASSLFHENAKNLNLSIKDIDFTVISHGHYDHGGGLKTFIEENPNAPVYLIEEAFNSYYAKKSGFRKKYIGLDKALITNFKHRFIFVKEFTQVNDNVFIISCIPEIYSKPLGNKKLLSASEGNFRPDDFKHELILVVSEHDGLVVFTGCSHNGILNMIKTVENRFKGKHIKTVFGGFHLMNPRTKKMSQGDQLCERR